MTFYASARCIQWLRYFGMVTPAEFAKLEALPLHSRTPLEWGRAVLADPIGLLGDNLDVSH